VIWTFDTAKSTLTSRVKVWNALPQIAVFSRAIKVAETPRCGGGCDRSAMNWGRYRHIIAIYLSIERISHYSVY